VPDHAQIVLLFPTVDHALFGIRIAFGVNHPMELVAAKLSEQLLDAPLLLLALARNYLHAASALLRIHAIGVPETLFASEILIRPVNVTDLE